MLLLVEHTNMIDGRPNYSWAKRFKQAIKFPSPYRIAKVAKSLCGLSASRGVARRSDDGATYTFVPAGGGEVVIARLAADDEDLSHTEFAFAGESQDLTATV